MGAESVEYHRATVLERADDFAGMALQYYASRGETPLMWGGSGCGSLGASGPVSPEAYEAVFGPGGASFSPLQPQFKPPTGVAESSLSSGLVSDRR